jgi:predicted MFS family arabinose efflux permease
LRDQAVQLAEHPSTRDVFSVMSWRDKRLAALPPAWRGSAIGIYRSWTDLGYGIGALGLGLVAHLTGALETAFWFISISMFALGAVLLYWGEEAHPRLNPAQQTVSEMGEKESAS